MKREPALRGRKKREPALRGRKKREPALRGRKKRCLGSCVLLALLGALAVGVFLVVARGEVSSLALATGAARAR